ncbi:MAG: nuclear transport factor 2 family protein [Chloroflexi bacterium]|nr:nuclear transport factor 2 family protein [Chloroflexota bacterium]
MRRMLVGAVGFVALLAVVAGLLSQSGTAAGTLTTDDYVEIRNLYSRYNHYIDNAKDEGWAFARLFTEDAVFETNIAVGTVRGHEGLAKLARDVGSATKVKPNHMVHNVVIDPSPEGAVGSGYYGVIVAPHEEGKQVSGVAWGIYTDRFVKTRDGWRFKSRKFTPAGWDHPKEWAAH